MRIVVDTYVIVSALMRTSGPPAIVLEAARADTYSWITSSRIIAELEIVLSRPHIRRRIDVSNSEITRLFVEMRQSSILVVPTQTIDVARDPDDNRVLEAAVAGEADFIVTGDRDLLDLGSHEGIPIVSPAEFVALLPG